MNDAPLSNARLLVGEGIVLRSWFIPAFFLISFLITGVGSNLSFRFGYWAIPIFGFGWLAIIVWFGILQK